MRNMLFFFCRFHSFNAQYCFLLFTFSLSFRSFFVEMKNKENILRQNKLKTISTNHLFTHNFLLCITFPPEQNSKKWKNPEEMMVKCREKEERENLQVFTVLLLLLLLFLKYIGSDELHKRFSLQWRVYVRILVRYNMKLYSLLPRRLKLGN